MTAKTLLALIAFSTSQAKVEDPSQGPIVLELPRAVGSPNAIANAGFEKGQGADLNHWTPALTQPPNRSDRASHSGFFSLHTVLENEGKRPSEGHLSQMVHDLDGDEEYTFSLWIKQVRAGVSYLQQYKIDWIDDTGRVIESSGFKPFKGTIGQWVEFSTELQVPEETVKAKLLFRFVTGAIDGAHGEAFLDDIALTKSSERRKEEASKKKRLLVKPLK